MATIALVCAAGVSGTFLARRLAGSLPDTRFVVTTEHALASALGGVDAVLLAPQVATAVDDIRRLAAPRPVAVLSAEAMTPTGALIAVDAVEAILDALFETATQPPTEKEIADA